MDKAEIRAKAEKLMGIQQISTYRHPHRFIQMDEIEAALTAAYDQGWDEGVEAAKVAYFEEGTVEAIRRLRKTPL